MKTISVLQNTDAEHLGLVEDHLEGRNIRFRYIRPAHDNKWIDNLSLPSDGLIILGAAPYGTVSDPKLPMLEQRVEIIENYLSEKLPILAFGTGTQLLALASGSTVKSRELTLDLQTARRVDDDALNGHLPVRYPIVTYMRDFPVIAQDARVLSVFDDDTAALFQISDNCLGFIGHPGMKSAMIEDSMVQMPAFDVANIDILENIRNLQPEIEKSLISIMTGVIQITGWMN
ncbi:MAG: hypothetical protein OXI60_05925 [Acidiferrobacterales bacterium]|nr:hypothetical protein [Acidiferrobacterales bacterium]